MKPALLPFVKFITFILKQFNVGIYRLSLSGPNAHGVPISDPLEHNSLESANKQYADPKVVNDYLSPERIKFYDDLINLLLAKGLVFDDKRLADVGCGPGVFLARINKKFAVESMFGFEHSAEAINVAKKKCPEAKFVEFDIYQNECTELFDCVFCMQVLEHLLDPERALRNLLSMVKRDGALVLTVPNGRTDTFLGHINFWSPESWKVFVANLCSNFICEVGIVEGGDIYAIVTHRTTDGC